MLSKIAPLLALLACACDTARADSASVDPPEAAPLAGAIDGPEPEAVPSPPGPPVDAPPALPGPTVDARAALAPSRPMPRTTALILDARERVGVTLGHPPGFLLDNPSLILMWQRGDEPQPKIVIKRLGGSGFGEARFAELDEACSAVGLVSPRWKAPQTAGAGPKRWPAEIVEGSGRGLGDGGPRRALAIVIDVPGLETIGVLGAWPESDDHASTVLDVVRHLERCRVVVGSGCVGEP